MKNNLKFMLLREKLGESQVSLAKKARVSRTGIWRIENYGDIPSLLSAIKIAKACNLKTIEEMEDIFLPSDAQI